MQQASMWVHCRMNNLLMNSGNKPETKLSSCTVFPVSSEVPTAVVLILSSQLVKKKKKRWTEKGQAESMSWYERMMEEEQEWQIKWVKAESDQHWHPTQATVNINNSWKTLWCFLICENWVFKAVALFSHRSSDTVETEMPKHEGTLVPSLIGSVVPQRVCLKSG